MIVVVMAVQLYITTMRTPVIFCHENTSLRNIPFLKHQPFSSPFEQTASCDHNTYMVDVVNIRVSPIAIHNYSNYRLAFENAVITRSMSTFVAFFATCQKKLLIIKERGLLSFACFPLLSTKFVVSLLS